MRTISIQTTQNVTIDYELAGVWERMLAYLLDTVIIGVYTALVRLLLLALSFMTHDSLFEMSDTSLIFLIIFVLPVYIGYHFISESMFGGQSIGKKALGIKVVKNDGQQMDMSDYAMRWMFRVIDITFSAGAIAVISIMSGTRNQRIGDLAGDTSVIKLNPKNKLSVKDILAIKSTSTHEATYEGVVNFTEDDMLLLKNTLERAKSHPNDHYRLLLKELAERICEQLDIKEVPKKRTAFLRKVLNDYIVLTR